MTEIIETEAIESARKFFDLLPSVPAYAYRVINLSNEGFDYYLVIFGKTDASIAIAAIGTTKGDIRISARLPGTSAHLTINKNRALELCNSDNNVTAEMVWEPGNLSRSPLYPIWKIYTSPKEKYINQQGIISGKPGSITAV
ncbi:MAG: hypothetical protein QM737_14520 [Ferruginibacter sp.]